MARKEHVKIAKRGAGAIIKWREKNTVEGLDLSGADLSGIDLRGADLSRCKLDNANFTRARLNSSDLYSVSAVNAVFKGADLRLARIRGTNMGGCDFSSAKFIGSTLRTVKLEGASMKGALFGGTIISAVDLSRVNGLESVKHMRKSSLGVDSITLSRGRIHPDFLRGAGIPEALVKFIINLAKDALGFYSCFISYTEANAGLSKKLYEKLEKKGVRCWRWREDLSWGRDLQPTIDQALEDHEKVIVILSEKSLEAEPVLYEIEKTIKREEGSQRGVLFPIYIDDAVFKWQNPLKEKVLKKHMGNFIGWEDSKIFRGAFNHLITDLRAEEKRL